MGENVTSHEKHSSPEAFREQIRRTESDITETLQALEQRLSPRFLRQRGVRKAKSLAWRGTAKVLDLAQHTSVQASIVAAGAAGAGAIWLLLQNRKTRMRRVQLLSRKRAGAAAKTLGMTALLMLIPKKTGGEKSGKKPAMSGIAWALTAAKAFMSGARSTRKSGTTQPGRKVAWRGLATTVGSALGSYWYSHRHRSA